MTTMAKIKAVVSEFTPPKIKIRDYVARYNAIVAPEDRLVCVSADCYLFDKFYTLSDVVTVIQNEIPSATEAEIIDEYNTIGGNEFDIPSICYLIKKNRNW